MRHTPQIAVFRLDGPYAIPLQTALEVTDRSRTVFLGAAGAVFGKDSISSELSGHGSQKNPLEGSHSHLHIFPLSSTPSQGIEYLGFMMNRQFTDAEKQALLSMDDLLDHDSGGVWVFEPILLGKLDDLHEKLPSGLERYFRPSVTWVSATPFLKSRHLRIRRSEKHNRHDYSQAIAREIGKNVRFELSNRSFPDPEVVRLRRDHLIEPAEAGISCASFCRRRSLSHGEDLDYGHSLVITFKKPVRGPLLLGKLSHFGMGLFTSR